MSDTSGFYKLDLESQGLAFAPNFVHAPGFSLRRDDEDSKVGTHDGWQWFETDTAAYIANGLVASVTPAWEISPLQAKLALLGAGLLDTVEAAIAASDRATQLAWSGATSFTRSSPLLNQLASGLGLSSTQLDNLFTTASKIVV